MNQDARHCKASLQWRLYLSIFVFLFKRDKWWYHDSLVQTYGDRFYFLWLGSRYSLLRLPNFVFWRQIVWSVLIYFLHAPWCMWMYLYVYIIYIEKMYSVGSWFTNFTVLKHVILLIFPCYILLVNGLVYQFSVSKLNIFYILIWTLKTTLNLHLKCSWFLVRNLSLRTLDFVENNYSSDLTEIGLLFC